MTTSFAHQQLSPVLTRRRGWHFPEGVFTHCHWCPGCNSFHDFAVEQPFHTNNARWMFNGDVVLPTMTPSMHIKIGPYSDGTIDVCHYFLTAGRILFLGDCTHALMGQTVDLPPLPEDKMIGWEKI